MLTKKSKKWSVWPTLKHSTRFSKLQLAVFLVVFAGAGAYIIHKSFAAVIVNPTHIVDAQWNFPGSGYDMTSVSVDIAPQADPTPDGYFYAAEFYYFNNFTGYMGLQDQGIDINGTTVAKTASITVYGATGTTPASGIQSSCWNPSGEGQQCNLNDVYNWVPQHTYRFSLSLQQANDGIGNEVWAVKFIDTTTGITNQLGTVKVPTSWQYLGHAIITFHERFSGPTDSCANIRYSSVIFSNALGNNGALTGTVGPPLNSGVNQTQCPGMLDNHITNNITYSSYGNKLTPAKTGDINGDGAINITDLSIVLSNWGIIGGVADLNKDNKVNIFDLSILLSNYGN
jgi:hypothetical protein